MLLAEIGVDATQATAIKKTACELAGDDDACPPLQAQGAPIGSKNAMKQKQEASEVAADEDSHPPDSQPQGKQNKVADRNFNSRGGSTVDYIVGRLKRDSQNESAPNREQASEATGEIRQWGRSDGPPGGVTTGKVRAESTYNGYKSGGSGKDFTPSERVAIAQELKERLGERRGRPAQQDDPPENVEKVPQLPAGEGESADEPAGPEVIVQKIGQLQPGQKTGDVAAKAAGFGNAETLRQAEAVVAHGAPELVQAMDSGEVSISRAQGPPGVTPAALWEIP